MSPRSHRRGGQLIPDYLCHARTLQYRETPCQIIPGGEVDRAMGQLLVEAMTPMTVHLTLSVQAELEGRLEQTDHLCSQQVERAAQEVEQARRRYLTVDPTHRLVAASLEADWNEKLRTLEDIRERVARARAADQTILDEPAKERIRALAHNFPAMWNDPTVPHRERKRQTHPKALARLEALLAAHTESEVASTLNAEGWTTGAGAAFEVAAVRWLQYRWKIKRYRDHLRDDGYLTTTERAAALGLGADQTRHWRRTGQLLATPYNDRGDQLFEPIQRQPREHSVTRSDGRGRRTPDSIIRCARCSMSDALSGSTCWCAHGVGAGGALLDGAV